MTDHEGRDSTDTSEFDDFGPWVAQVERASQVPPLYRDHPLDLERAELVLKVPRDIERRNANPSMDLYDALIIVDTEETTVLVRTEGAYTTRKVSHERLVAVTHAVVLLDARVTLYVEDEEPLVLRYNGSSERVMTRLVDLLRRLRTGRSTRGPLSSGPGARSGEVALPTDERDVGVLNSWRSLAGREPSIAAIAAHSSIVVAPTSGFVSRAAHRLHPMVLRAAVFAASTDELHVVHRSDWLSRGRSTDLSHAHTVVFRDDGAIVHHRPHPRYEQVTVLTVGPRDGAVEIDVPAGSGAVDAVTSALGQRA